MSRDERESRVLLQRAPEQAQSVLTAITVNTVTSQASTSSELQTLQLNIKFFIGFQVDLNL